jgi:hypothetical protein
MSTDFDKPDPMDRDPLTEGWKPSPPLNDDSDDNDG